MTGPFEADGQPQGVNGVGIRVLFVHLGSRKWTNLDYRKPETGPCSGPTDRMTTAGRGEVDSVFVTSMLGAQTHAELMESVYLPHYHHHPVAAVLYNA